MASYQFASCSDDKIWRTYFSQHEYPSVVAGIKFGVFESVQWRPKSKKEILEETNLGQRGGTALLGVLTACEYLKVIDGKYYLAEVSQNYLLKSSKISWVPFMAAESEATKGMIDALRADYEISKSPSKEMPTWIGGNIPVEDGRKISAFMHSHSLTSAIALAEKVDLASVFHVDRLLDVGGGSGCFSIAIVLTQPNVKCTVIELADVHIIAEEYVREARVDQSRVTCISGNMFTQPFPTNYNGIFYSNILHDWSLEKCRFICKKTFDSLPENGYILIHEALLNDDESGPWENCMFSMHMFLHTEGAQFTFTSLKKLLLQVGFKEIAIRPIHGNYSLVSGKKILENLGSFKYRE